MSNLHSTANVEPVSVLANRVSAKEFRIFKIREWRLRGKFAKWRHLKAPFLAAETADGLLTRGTVGWFRTTRKYAEETASAGWGARIRTWEWRNQNPLPYHLATPHHAVGLPLARWAARWASHHSGVMFGDQSWRVAGGRRKAVKFRWAAPIFEQPRRGADARAAVREVRAKFKKVPR